MRHPGGRTTKGDDLVAARRSNAAMWGFTVTHETIGFSGMVDLDALSITPVRTSETVHRVVLENLTQHHLCMGDLYIRWEARTCGERTVLSGLAKESTLK